MKDQRMQGDDQHASTESQIARRRLTRRERRERRAGRKREAIERRREAIYKHATVFVTCERADSAVGTSSSGKPRVERRLNAGDHVVLHRRNRAFVVGWMIRAPLVLRAATWGLAVAVSGACITWLMAAWQVR